MRWTCSKTRESMYEGRLRISEACPLILPCHVALDNARETAKGLEKIGTTGRGIGPAYEDKVARRAVRLQDLFHRDRFAAKLGEMLDYHNFVLKNYFHAPVVDFQQTMDDTLSLAERIKPMMADVPRLLFEADGPVAICYLRAHKERCLISIMAPIRSLRRATALPARRQPGAALARKCCITYWASPRLTTTRVGAGPFPTELDNDVGRHLAKRGNEFGATTGRPRRCGWFDAAALKRSIQINGVSGLCVTKLDVMDGVETLRLGVGYKLSGNGEGKNSGRSCQWVRKNSPAANLFTRKCQDGLKARWGSRTSKSYRSARASIS